MARRRVFETSIECPEIQDLGITANRKAVIGRAVAFEKSASTVAVAVLLDGRAIGHLDDVVGPQVALAMERGQVFGVVVKNARQKYNERFKPTSAVLCLKAGYLLEGGQSPIQIPEPQTQVQPQHQYSPSSFHTKVAGVSHNGRQIVARCSVGERLMLVRDPKNRFDKGAIKVMRLSGEQLGFIPADVSRGGHSSGLAFQMDRGYEYQCRISALTGGGDKFFGVNIEITEAEQFDTPLSTNEDINVIERSAGSSNLGWLFVAAAVLLVLVVVVVLGR